MKTFTIDTKTHKVVPIDPAKELQIGFAYLDAAREDCPDSRWQFSHAGYKAMIAAAPEYPADAFDIELISDTLEACLWFIKCTAHDLSTNFPRVYAIEKKEFDELVSKITAAIASLPPAPEGKL
jgi:hypothetical protein